MARSNFLALRHEWASDNRQIGLGNDLKDHKSTFVSTLAYQFLPQAMSDVADARSGITNPVYIQSIFDEVFMFMTSIGVTDNIMSSQIITYLPLIQIIHSCRECCQSVLAMLTTLIQSYFIGLLHIRVKTIDIFVRLTVKNQFQEFLLVNN